MKNSKDLIAKAGSIWLTFKIHTSWRLHFTLGLCRFHVRKYIAR